VLGPLLTLLKVLELTSGTSAFLSVVPASVNQVGLIACSGVPLLRHFRFLVLRRRTSKTTQKLLQCTWEGVRG